MDEPQSLRRAELLAIGSELLVGETRDTHSSDLAAALTTLGVEVLRSSQLPDRLADVVDALTAALSRADLVITTGGLGPTPDDLTREAIAAALDRPVAVDAELEAWLRGLWARRGLPFSETNLKQAWLVPGAEALPNPNGTAPGWWVEHEGGVVVALPGPPRELHPMWADHVLPRLAARGVGVDHAEETLHLVGIGESALVDVIGQAPLHAENPRMATYAKSDSVDVRVSATGDLGRTAADLLATALADVLPRLAPYVFARGAEGWRDALAHRLAGRRVAVVEVGTGGELTTMIGSAAWLASAQHLPVDSPLLHGPGSADPALLASATRRATGAAVGLAVVAQDDGEDMHAEVAVDIDGHVHRAKHAIFRGGEIGRRRAATAGCAELWRLLER